MSAREVHALPIRPDSATQYIVNRATKAPPTADLAALAAAGVCRSCNNANCDHKGDIAHMALAMKAPKKSIGARRKAKAAMKKAEEERRKNQETAIIDVNMDGNIVLTESNVPADSDNPMVLDATLATDASASLNGAPPKKKRRIPKEFWPRKPTIFPPKPPYNGPNPLNVPPEIFERICGYLPIPTLVNLALVCRSHFNFLNDPNTHTRIWVPARAQYFNMPGPSMIVEGGAYSESELRWALMWFGGGECEFCGRYSYTTPVAFGTSRIVRVCLMQDCRSFWRAQMRKQTNKKEIPGPAMNGVLQPSPPAMAQGAIPDLVDLDDEEPPSGMDLIPRSVQGLNNEAMALGLPHNNLAGWLKETKNVFEYLLANDSLLNALRMRAVDEQVPWLHYAMRVANDSADGTGPLNCKRPNKKVFHAIDNYMNSRRRRAKRLSPFPEFLCYDDQIQWPSDQLRQFVMTGLPFVELGPGVSQDGNIGSHSQQTYIKKRKFRVSDVVEAIDEWNTSTVNGTRDEVIEKWLARCKEGVSNAEKMRELALWRNKMKKKGDDVRHQNDTYLRNKVKKAFEVDFKPKGWRKEIEDPLKKARKDAKDKREELRKKTNTVMDREQQVKNASDNLEALREQLPPVPPHLVQLAEQTLRGLKTRYLTAQASAFSKELELMGFERALAELELDQATIPPAIEGKALAWQDGSNAPTLVRERILAQVDMVLLNKDNDVVWRRIRNIVAEECDKLHRRRVNREKEAKIHDSQCVIRAFHRNCNREEEKLKAGVKLVPPFGVFKLLPQPHRLPNTIRDLKNWDPYKDHMNEELRKWEEQYRNILTVKLDDGSGGGISPDDACALFRCDACDKKTARRRSETNEQIVKGRLEAQSKKKVYYNPMPQYKGPMTWTQLVDHQCTDRWDVENFVVDRPAAALARKACRLVGLDIKTSPEVLDTMGKAWKCQRKGCSVWMKYGELYKHCLRHAWDDANQSDNSKTASSAELKDNENSNPKVELKDLFPEGISNTDRDQLNDRNFTRDIVASGFVKPDCIRTADVPVNGRFVPNPNYYVSAPPNFCAKMMNGSAEVRNLTRALCCRCCVVAREVGIDKAKLPCQLTFDGLRDHCLQKHHVSEIHSEDLLLIVDGSAAAKAAKKAKP